MIVTRTVDGNINTYWRVLMQGLRNDIDMSNPNHVKFEDIGVGYSYTKKMGNRLGQRGDVLVTITALKENDEYAAEFHSVQGTNTLSYKLDPVDDNSFTVTYTEGFSSEKRFNDWNFKIVSFLYNRGSKKRANSILDRVEEEMEE
ncbi:MAG: DUF3284 domain-containing protein [Bifidobacteriaceae bacterium]|jgi:hypothetical protein|nr:DUF3284 domain-containing protein [Bifidobacteriaceae bacterium]